MGPDARTLPVLTGPQPRSPESVCVFCLVIARSTARESVGVSDLPSSAVLCLHARSLVTHLRPVAPLSRLSRPQVPLVPYAGL